MVKGQNSLRPYGEVRSPQGAASNHEGRPSSLLQCRHDLDM